MMFKDGKKVGEKHTLQNHGGMTVRFLGESLARESTKTEQEDQAAWCDMELFRTDRGKFVATVCLVTREKDFRKVFVEEDERHLSKYFAPKSADFLHRFQYFEHGHRQEFDEAVSRLFEKARLYRDVE